MGCTQSKDQVLHESHAAITKYTGKSIAKDDEKKNVAMEMERETVKKHVDVTITNNIEEAIYLQRKEKLEAIEEEKEEEEEHESEDELFYSADEESNHPNMEDYHNSKLH